MASPPRRLPHRLLVMAIAALAALGGPGLATAAPSLLAPLSNAAVPVRPTFTWAPGAQDNPVRYQVYVTSPTAVGALQAGDNLVSPPVLAPTTSVVSNVDLPEGVLLTWFVRSFNASNQSVDTPLVNRNTIRVAPPSPTLTLTPAALSATTTPTFSWSGDRATSHWTIFDASGTPVQGGEVAAPSGQATAALASGTFRLEVIQRNLIGAESPPAAAAFTIDATPPVAPAISASRPSPTVGITPSFAWSGVEAGATSWWRVIGAGGVVVQGPTNTSAASAAPASLGTGSYSFEVRQVDAVGNSGPWATEPFSILPAPATPPAGAGGTTSKLPSSNTKRLSPRVGATVTSTRPTLKWTKGPKGTRLYNVQIFLVGKNNVLRKVRTAFPKTRSFRLSSNAALAKGSCYVWRVWPYRGSAFTSTPLGVSNFCVRK
jgi:hypothetical protein